MSLLLKQALLGTRKAVMEIIVGHTNRYGHFTILAVIAVAGRTINAILTLVHIRDVRCADGERGESRVPIKLKNVDELNDHSTVKGHVDLS